MRLSVSDTATVELAPLVREELEVRLQTRGRTPRDSSLVREILSALRSGKDKLVLSKGAMRLILSELEEALSIIKKDKWLSQEPAMKYHSMALEYALENLRTRAASVLAHIRETQRNIRCAHIVDHEEVASLVNAAASIVDAVGKCPKGGCVMKRKNKWRVISNRTGKLWPQTYATKKDAQDAIAAYQIRRRGVPHR